MNAVPAPEPTKSETLQQRNSQFLYKVIIIQNVGESRWIIYLIFQFHRQQIQQQLQMYFP